ncbi:resolvase [Salipiger abyssi]|uniref:resolvase n=1 Tax=Salipiger abyssi TaxID=1250539 RepID=UPI0040584AF5
MNDIRETDLFGNPVRAGKGAPGRPRKELTATDLDMLEAGLMQGWTNQRIAKSLGIGVSTLKRNFGPLLRMRDQMPDRLRLLIFSTAVRKSLEGDMGAIRQVRQLMEDNERRLAAARIDRAGEAEPPEAPVGKKERARRAAEQVAESGGGDLWGGDLSPGSYH